MAELPLPDGMPVVEKPFVDSADDLPFRCHVGLQLRVLRRPGVQVTVKGVVFPETKTRLTLDSYNY